MRDDDSLGQNGNSEEVKQLNSGDTLHVKHTGFVDDLDTEERKKRIQG